MKRVYLLLETMNDLLNGIEKSYKLKRVVNNLGEKQNSEL